jgi:MoaA/NifB/PqqE/SkfB family radical SAM enzyme
VVGGAESSRSQLILTVTRACNLRCSYCPTVKDGWPSLSTDDARRAVALFDERYGGGQIKMFGGEPLLVPDVVRAALHEARDRDSIERVYLSTNGLGLDLEWLQTLRDYPKAVLTISLDGVPEDNRLFRRALPGIGDAYDHVISLLPELLRTPRVVITQTIPPKTAGHAATNFAHLRSLGFWRFNLLPGYYIPWKEPQIEALARGFDGIEAQIRDAWDHGERLYLRNLFTRAPTPFFNTGLVVDADRTIHPSNVGLSGQLDGLRGQTQVGTLDDPPSPEALAARSAEVNGLLESVLPERVWESTMAVDRLLTRLCERLYPAYFAHREARAEAVS